MMHYGIYYHTFNLKNGLVYHDRKYLVGVCKSESASMAAYTFNKQFPESKRKHIEINILAELCTKEAFESADHEAIEKNRKLFNLEL